MFPAIGQVMTTTPAVSGAAAQDEYGLFLYYYTSVQYAASAGAGTTDSKGFEIRRLPIKIVSYQRGTRWVRLDGDTTTGLSVTPTTLSTSADLYNMPKTMKFYYRALHELAEVPT